MNGSVGMPGTKPKSASMTAATAIARGRLEIKAKKDPHYGEALLEPETDEVGRTPDEMENIFD